MPQRKHINRMAGVAALALLFGAGTAQSQTTGATSGATSGSAATTAPATTGKSGQTLSRADQNIMRDIAQSNLAEIEAGKIALKQSKNDQVKTFAQKMIDDHTQAQKDLEQLAQAKGVTLPTEPDNKHKAAAKKLSALEGDKFDKQYISKGGVSDHRDTHRLLERAQNRATDPDLKALAAKMTPIVSQHLTMAQDVRSAKGTVSGSMGPAGTSDAGVSGSSGTSGTSGTSPSDTEKPGTSGASGTPGTPDSTAPGKQ